MRTPKNFRLPKVTCDTLASLAERWGVSQAEVIIIAVDRLNQKENEDANKT